MVFNIIYFVVNTVFFSINTGLKLRNHGHFFGDAFYSMGRQFFS